MQQFYSIGGAAGALGVSPSLLRKLEGRGVIPAPARLGGSDRRVYQPADLLVIRERLEERRRERRPAGSMGDGGAPNALTAA